MPEWFYADEWQDWEIEPSTRSSVHLWTKAQPVDVTLSVAGTAEDLINLSPGIPTVNLATNPSFETGAPPTGYTATGSAISQSAVVARNGSNSILVNPDNAAAGEGFYWSMAGLGGGPGDNNRYLVASIYIQDNAGSGNDARLYIADSDGTLLLAGNTITLSASWQRSQASLALATRGNATYRIYVATVSQHNTNFYCDSFQVEIGRNSTPTAYCDGSLGLHHEWEATAQASRSRRRRGLAAIRGYTLHTTRDIYISEDVTASSTTGRYVRAGTDFWNDWPIDVESNVSFVNVNVGETPRVYGQMRGVPTFGGR